MIYPTYLNGIKVSGSGVPHISLTQAEYDALSVEAKNNGTIYFITDAVGGSGDFAFIQNGDCYSTEERMIGCWIDGKPLYQKTKFSTSNLSYNALNTVSLGISNVDKFVSVTGFIAYGNDKNFIPLPYGDRGNSNVCIAGINADNGEAKVWIGSDYQSFNVANLLIITVQYTKTTDTAGSGSWTPSGMPAIHYSTDEQIIGTWIDGSTLYEKTVNFGAIPSYTTKDVAHNISNLGRVVDIKGVMNSDVFETIPSGENTNFRVLVTSSVVRIISGGSWSGWNDSYITIRYTKS